MIAPAAWEQRVDPCIVPIVSMHYEDVLEAIEVQGLVGEPADEPSLEKRRPHVLEESFGSTFIHLEIEEQKLTFLIFY